MPERADIDNKKGRQDSKSDWRYPARCLFFGEKPPAKPADAERHRHKGCSEHANGVADKGGQRGVQTQRSKDRAEETHLKHHDRKQSQNNEKSGLPVWWTFAGHRIDRHPAGERRRQAHELLVVDEGLGLREQFRTLRGLHPGFEVLSGVEAHDGRPEAVLFGGWLEIHSAVAGVFPLGSLNSDCPFAIRVVHPGLDLLDDHFGDVRAGRLTGPVCLRHLAKAAAFAQRVGLANNFSPLTRALPGAEFVLRTEIQDNRPFIAFRLRGRDDVAADETVGFTDDDVVPRLPGGEGLVFAGAKFSVGDENCRRAHLDATSTGSSAICTLLAGGFPLTNSEKMRAAVKGRLVQRTPVAFLMAFAIAGATGLIAHSPCDFAPSGPILS